MSMIPPEYPPEWDEPDFEDIYGNLIDEVTIYLLNFDYVAADEAIGDDSDIYAWLESLEDANADDLINGVEADRHARQFAYQYIQHKRCANY